MRNYLWIIFWGIAFTFLYNFYAALLRAVGDSVTPLWFLAVSVVLNIGLDLFLILVLDQGIEGAGQSQRSSHREWRHPVSCCTPIKPAPNYDYTGKICASTVPA